VGVRGRYDTVNREATGCTINCRFLLTYFYTELSFMSQDVVGQYTASAWLGTRVRVELMTANICYGNSPSTSTQEVGAMSILGVLPSDVP